MNCGEHHICRDLPSELNYKQLASIATTRRTSDPRRLTHLSH